MSPQARTQTLEQRVTQTETWLRWLLRASGITLVGLLAFAFWLGTISAKVSNTEQMVNKLYAAVSEDPNSLMVRASLIENRFTFVENRLTVVEGKLNSMDAKLDEIVRRMDKLERSIAGRKR